MADDQYEVGKGRPPKSTRWNKGQSGNPSARKKKRRTLSDELADLLDEEVETVVDGEASVMTVRRVIARAIAVKAMKGELRAVTLVVANDNERGGEDEDVLPGQEGLLERFAQRFLRREKLEGGGSHD